jgi:hypothetical protein
MKARILAAAATVMALGLAAPAFAAAPADNTTSNCFLTRDWQDWHGAAKDVIYLRVHSHDFWKIGLSGGSNMVTDPTNHLINDIRGGNSWVCKPIDLDLKISDGHIVEPLFVKSIEKLTPEQVALIPKKDLP